MRVLADSAPKNTPIEKLNQLDAITKSWPNEWHRNALNSTRRIDNFLTIDKQYHEWLSQLKPAEFAFVIEPVLSNTNELLSLYHNPATETLRQKHSVYECLMHMDLYLTLANHYPEEKGVIDNQIGKHEDELYSHKHYTSLDNVLGNIKRLTAINAFSKRITANNSSSHGAFWISPPTGITSMIKQLEGKMAGLQQSRSFSAMNSEKFAQQLTEVEQILYRSASAQLSTTPGLFRGWKVPGTGRDPGVDQLYKDIRNEYEPWYGDEAAAQATEEEKSYAPGSP
ncbi:MAG: hypothetical protein P1U63_01630 [Coxiellaceae bacterium]|nr:hypothetical protein [Coxiellaceae bacterium]